MGLCLGGAGSRVIGAGDGVDALMTLAQRRVDVILSGITSGGHGFDHFTELRARLERLAIAGA